MTVIVVLLTFIFLGSILAASLETSTMSMQQLNSTTRGSSHSIYETTTPSIDKSCDSTSTEDSGRVVPATAAPVEQVITREGSDVSWCWKIDKPIISDIVPTVCKGNNSLGFVINSILFRDNSALSQYENLTSRLAVTITDTAIWINITQVQLIDVGLYSVRVSKFNNITGYFLKASLTVLRKLSLPVVNFAGDTMFTVGSLVTMYCNASTEIAHSTSTTLTYEWLLNGLKVTNANITISNTTGKLTLRFTSANSGFIFSCRIIAGELWSDWSEAVILPGIVQTTSAAQIASESVSLNSHSLTLEGVSHVTTHFISTTSDNTTLAAAPVVAESGSLVPLIIYIAVSALVLIIVIVVVIIFIVLARRRRLKESEKKVPITDSTLPHDVHEHPYGTLSSDYSVKSMPPDQSIAGEEVVYAKIQKRGNKMSSPLPDFEVEDKGELLDTECNPESQRRPPSLTPIILGIPPPPIEDDDYHFYHSDTPHTSPKQLSDLLLDFDATDTATLGWSTDERQMEPMRHVVEVDVPVGTWSFHGDNDNVDKSSHVAPEEKPLNTAGIKINKNEYRGYDNKSLLNNSLCDDVEFQPPHLDSHSRALRRVEEIDLQNDHCANLPKVFDSDSSSAAATTTNENLATVASADRSNSLENIPASKKVPTSVQQALATNDGSNDNTIGATPMDENKLSSQDSASKLSDNLQDEIVTASEITYAQLMFPAQAGNNNNNVWVRRSPDSVTYVDIDVIRTERLRQERSRQPINDDSIKKKKVPTATLR